ncbi:uncharacterized protein LOC107414039 [Ziziphus jujuba]|uniref:Uncharacterized protein LOC107414039 n=1 Tax=Ziziphus jujuba TaxID=326968 RepID=A0A6P3ZEQ7_ZIZJJ|nr:uncharacterized protein LOC107414039 [Ziziphus jujuba]
MSKASSRVIRGLLSLHFSHTPKPSSISGSLSRTHHSSSSSPSTGFRSLPTSSNGVLPRYPSSPSYNPHAFSSGSLGFSKLGGSSHGFGPIGPRFFSLGSSGFGKANGNFAKKVFDKPVSALTSTFTRYREAIGLQIEAFCRRNYLFLLGAGGLLLCALLWKVLFAIADSVVGISEGLAKYGFLALSSAIVAFTGLYLRSRFTINPDKVYRMAMRKLNTSASILEVMGAPLSGSEIRAYVMSGGGPTLKNFKPAIRSKRCFLIFPIRGAERKGLVSVEAKKKKGQYNMKLLAVDIPMTSGPDQRLFLIGDELEYKVGGGLISELRDPIVKAMAATKEFDELDEIEEEEDAERELKEAERKNREEIEKLEKDESR